MCVLDAFITLVVMLFSLCMQKKDNNTVRYELENENASLHEKVKYLMDENRKLQMEKSDLEEILKNNKVKYEETLVKLRSEICFSG